MAWPESLERKVGRQTEGPTLWRGAECTSQPQTPEMFLAWHHLVSPTASSRGVAPGFFTSLKNDFIRDD